MDAKRFEALDKNYEKIGTLATAVYLTEGDVFRALAMQLANGREHRDMGGPAQKQANAHHADGSEESHA